MNHCVTIVTASCADSFHALSTIDKTWLSRTGQDSLATAYDSNGVDEGMQAPKAATSLNGPVYVASLYYACALWYCNMLWPSLSHSFHLQQSAGHTRATETDLNFACKHCSYAGMKMTSPSTCFCAGCNKTIPKAYDNTGLREFAPDDRKWVQLAVSGMNSLPDPNDIV